MSKRKTCLFILAFALLVTIKNGQASCAFSPAASTQSYTAPLDNRTFSVPPDLSVGQVIARQYVNFRQDGSPRIIKCSTGPIYMYYQYATLPNNLAAGFTDVYQTSVAGIGVRYYVSRTEYPSFPYSRQSTTATSYPATSNSVNFFIEFIKTAETVTPGQVLASSLPTTEHAVGQETSKVVYAKIQMSGQFNITVPTCNIVPASTSMTVPMGNQLTNSFSGIGSGTSWKNASIQLTNCPQFYGNANLTNRDASQSSYSNSNNSPPTQYALVANTLSLTLSPRNGVIDAANGIMKIDEETGSATGVGIQLSSSESTSAAINLNNAILRTLSKNAGITNITIPLYARYIQTESTISAGKANGRLEYTITYQ